MSKVVNPFRLMPHDKRDKYTQEQHNILINYYNKYYELERDIESLKMDVSKKSTIVGRCCSSEEESSCILTKELNKKISEFDILRIKYDAIMDFIN